MTRRAALGIAFLGSTSFAADPALLHLLPSGSAVILGVHVEQARNSAFGQYMLSRMKTAERDLATFVQMTGFDPLPDLREIVMASPKLGAVRGLLLARGTFDIGRILAAAQAKGATATIYRGTNVIAGKNEARDGWVALLDSSTAIAGDPEQVKAAIDRRGGRAALDESTLASINDLSGRYDAWMHTLAPGAMIPLPSGPPQNQEVFSAIERAAGGVKFGSNVRLYAEAIARTPKDATAIQDVIRFMAGLIQMNRDKPDATPIATLLEALQVTTSGNGVQVSLTIAQEELERLLEANRPRGRRKAAL